MKPYFKVRGIVIQSLQTVRNLFYILFFFGCAFGIAIDTNGQEQQGISDTSLHPFSINLEELKWAKIVPALGDRSAEIAILHIDPKTQATQLMIRVPQGYHAPMQWHSANETHTVIRGTFIVEYNGKKDTLKSGSFNYIPAKMHHQVWTTKNEGALLFITVDKARNINWVGDPPKPDDFIVK